VENCIVERETKKMIANSLDFSDECRSFFFFVVLLFLPGPIDLLNCECGFYGIILSAFQLIKYVNYHAFVFLTVCIG